MFRSPGEHRLWALIEEVADQKTVGVVDQLTKRDFETLVEDWEIHSGISVTHLMQTVNTIRKHGDALEADLIKDGLRIRHCPTPEFTWHDLYVYIRHVPLTSNLYHAMFPDKAGWDRTNMLLAEAVDTLHWLRWAKTKSGQKGRDRPAPVPRPGVTPPPRDGAKPKAAPLSEIKRKFAARHRKISDRATKIADMFGKAGGR